MPIKKSVKLSGTPAAVVAPMSRSMHTWTTPKGPANDGAVIGRIPLVPPTRTSRRRYDLVS
jgi:hypothetical protein